MTTFFNALIETLNPRGGKGMKETLVFIALLAAFFVLNILQIPASEELKLLLTLGIGYMTGQNVKKQVEKQNQKIKE